MADDARTPVREAQRATIEQVGDLVLARMRRKGRSQSAIIDVQGNLSNHLVPYFGTKAVGRITRSDIEQYIDFKLTERTRRAPDGYSPKTVRNHLSTLHSVLELAIRDGHATVNHVKHVDKPGDPATTVKEIRFLTVEELDAVIARADDHPIGRLDGLMWLTSALTGMRQSELRALKWHDIDWLSSRVRIHRAEVRGEVKTTKSVRSFRSVPLATRLMRELELYHRRTAFGGDDELVFAHPETGNAYDSSRALKRFKRACKAAKVFKTNRLHDLRHTFGTQMAAQGVPMRTLQEWMGHRDLETTLIYADYAPGAREAEWIDAAFAPSGLVGQAEPADTGSI